jgi:branched-chain amino acid transport system permease protein
LSNAVQFYVSTLAIYLAVDVIACWGFNLQYGVAGIMNFAFIMFQAVGAYTAALLTLGPSSGHGGYQHYIFGADLPFPAPLVAAGAASGLLALVVGLVTLRRLRQDYQAMVMLVVSLMATSLAQNWIGLVNGPAGLSLIAQPLADQLNLPPITYQWAYVGYSLVLVLLVLFVVQRITNAPLGRTLRAMRDNEHAAAALGKNVTALRLTAFIVGAVIAGVSGAVLVQFIGAWAPGSWLYVETFTLLTAIIVGGSGNNLGVFVGALLVPVGFLEGSRFLPDIGPLGLNAALQWIAVGTLALLFLWFWPRGVFPEARRRFSWADTSASSGWALRLLRKRKLEPPQTVR